jgi:hypothetical protein
MLPGCSHVVLPRKRGMIKKATVKPVLCVNVCSRCIAFSTCDVCITTTYSSISKRCSGITGRVQWTLHDAVQEP